MLQSVTMLREALLSARDSIKNVPLYDEREARSITDLLLEEICAITRTDRVLHPGILLPPLQRKELERCASLLASGVPVQQILGYEWFCGRKFFVTPDVLIPRPETAELIGWIDEVCNPAGADSPDGSAPARRILDIGTGSGCIAITLAQVINHSQILAVDLSTAALDVARRNADEQGVENIQFAQYDILNAVDNSGSRQPFNELSTAYQPDMPKVCQQELSHGYPPLSDTCSQDINTTFDLIVSNPPYICRHEGEGMSSVVLQHEPDMALFVPDNDPLLFYRAIARFAQQHLAADGDLFFEINAAYGSPTCEMLRMEGFSQVGLRKDINGRDRMIRARR